jgi:hypothetical protein
MYYESSRSPDDFLVIPKEESKDHCELTFVTNEYVVSISLQQLGTLRRKPVQNRREGGLFMITAKVCLQSIHPCSTSSPSLMEDVSPIER